MANFKVAKRYAKGLYDYTASAHNTEVIYAEMKDLNQLLKDSKDLKTFFQSPVIDYRKKQNIAQQIFTTYSKEVQEFIQLVILHGRESNLLEITHAFTNLVDFKKGIQKAVLTSAVELDPSTVDAIVKKSNLIQNTDTYQLTQKVDPEILGGYILRVGDQQIDASVKNKFNQLRNEFEVNHYIPKF